MRIDWDTIKYIFQLPLEWFQTVHKRIFKSYGEDFITVKEGYEGGLEIGVDKELLADAVTDVLPDIGYVTSVDGKSPDSSGNVNLGLTPDKWVKTDSQGHLTTSQREPVLTVNGIGPDVNGNVNVSGGGSGTVVSVDGITADASGNVPLGAVRTTTDQTIDGEKTFIQPTDWVGEDEIGYAETHIDFGWLQLQQPMTPGLNLYAPAIGKMVKMAINNGDFVLDTITQGSNCDIVFHAPSNQTKLMVHPHYPDPVIDGQEYIEPKLNPAIVDIAYVETRLEKYVQKVQGIEPDENGEVIFDVEPGCYVITDENGHLTTTDEPAVFSVDDITPDQDGNVNLGAVRTTTNQNIDGLKTFIQNLQLKIDASREDYSRGTAGVANKKLIFIDTANQSFADLSAQAESQGRNVISLNLNRIGLQTDGKIPYIQLEALNDDNTQAKIQSDLIQFRCNTNIDKGRINLSPSSGLIEIRPDTDGTDGGTIRFFNPNTGFATTIINDTQNSSNLISVKNVIIRTDGVDQTIKLHAGANNTVLENSPTVPTTDKQSKVVATCGWVNTVVDDAFNNIHLNNYQRLDQLDQAGHAASYDTLTQHYVTLDTQQVIEASKTIRGNPFIWTNQGQVNQTLVNNNQIYTPQLLIRNYTSQQNVLSVINKDALGVQFNSPGPIDIRTNGTSEKIKLIAGADCVELANQPTSEDENSLAVATVGYVQSKCGGNVKSVDGIDPDENGNIDFGLTPNKFVKTDNQGHLTVADNSPVLSVDTITADQDGNVNLGAVRTTTNQTVNGIKTFTSTIKLKVGGDVNASSRTSSSRALSFRDDSDASYGAVELQATPNGTNQIVTYVSKPSVAQHSALTVLRVNSAGVSKGEYRVDSFDIRRPSNLDTDGHIIFEPRYGRLEFYPATDIQNGGYIDFHYQGNTADYTSRIIENLNTFAFLSLQKDVAITASGTDKGINLTATKNIVLNAPANQSALINPPTVGRTDKTSKSIATCGWVNTQVDAAFNNLNLNNYQRLDQLDQAGKAASYNNLTQHYVTLDTSQTITESKTIQKIWVWLASGSVSRSWISNTQVGSNELVVYNPNSQQNTLQLYSDGALGAKIASAGGIDITTSGSAQLVKLSAASDCVVLANQPQSEDENSLAVATVGYVQQHSQGKVKSVDGIEPNEDGDVNFGLSANSIVSTDGNGHLTTIDNGQSTTVNMVTDVSWNGTQLVIQSKTLTFENGLLTGTSNNPDKKINTVTYNP